MRGESWLPAGGEARTPVRTPKRRNLKQEKREVVKKKSEEEEEEGGGCIMQLELSAAGTFTWLKIECRK